MMKEREEEEEELLGDTAQVGATAEELLKRRT